MASSNSRYAIQSRASAEVVERKVLNSQFLGIRYHLIPRFLYPTPTQDLTIIPLIPSAAPTPPRVSSPVGRQALQQRGRGQRCQPDRAADGRGGHQRAPPSNSVSSHPPDRTSCRTDPEVPVVRRAPLGDDRQDLDELVPTSEPARGLVTLSTRVAVDGNRECIAHPSSVYTRETAPRCARRRAAVAPRPRVGLCTRDRGANSPRQLGTRGTPVCPLNPGLPHVGVSGMSDTFVTRRWRRLVSVAAILTLPFVASGQRRDRFRDQPATTHIDQTGQFIFTCIRYGGYRSTWSHDYPRADRHLPRILDDLTTIDVHLGDSNVFRLDDPELFTHPIAYISEPGFWSMSPREVQGLRDYWLKGGFVIFDDFEAEQWNNFALQVRRALPDHRLIEIDVTHPIFQVFFGMTKLDVQHPLVRVEQRWTPSTGQLINVAKWNLLRYLPVKMRGAEDDQEETAQSFASV